MNLFNFFPLDYDASIYRDLYSDLKDMSDDQLRAHYLRFGINEGRRAHILSDRTKFTGLISSQMSALEIGPFVNPVISGENVRYADYLSSEELVARANLLKREILTVPHIDYVLSGMKLDEINDDFDAVISSHAIEHQPDFINHLLAVDKLIRKKDGRYFMLIPDKRYCFDRDMPLTTVADLLEAHLNKCTVHSLGNIISHLALTVHNDSRRHWNEKGNEVPVNVDVQKVLSAINIWKQSNGGYVDVHAWFFTPKSFSELIDFLFSMGTINLCVDRVFPTLKNRNEFYCILKCGR